MKRLLSMWLHGKELMVAKLVADSTYSADGARIEAFLAQGHSCKQTFYNIKNRLRIVDSPDVPKIVLQKRPPGVVQFSEMHAAKR